MKEIKAITELDRKQAEEDASLESKEADLKQHADKLVRGFENIDDASANRAIWELVQNACDLSAKCNVTIDYRKNGFSFSHNGKPFNSATLLSLIKQVSNKYDGEEVGKFGTGFITTHAFGRKFIINSLLNLKGRFIRIKDFLIDRSATEWKGMVASLIEQEKEVYRLIHSGEIAEDGDDPTTFTYMPESKTEYEYIKESFSTLHSYIPIVLTLNERLFSVTVIEEKGTKIIYSKTDKTQVNGVYKTTIQKNGTPLEIFSLRNEVEGIEVVLPLVTNNEAIIFDDKIAKLFLYYPLIGTEQWGCNFIIHSKNFAPTEPRDGIHLNSKTEQVQNYEEANRKLILKASEMIFEFVKNSVSTIRNPIHLAQIDFKVNSDKTLLNDYFQELKNIWIEKFKEYKLVETETANTEPSKAAFLDNELLLDEKYFSYNYSIARKFWKNLPQKKLVKDWTKIVDDWGIEDISYVKIEHIVTEIQNAGYLKSFDNSVDLQLFYKYLIENGHGELFNKYKLLPNLNGEFRKLSELNNNINLPKILIEIAEVIMPDVPKRHIHPDFKFNLEFTPYNRKNFTSDINNHIAKQVGEKVTSENIEKKYLIKLLDYCKIASTVDSDSVPSKMIKLICRYYKESEDLIAIPAIKEDLLDNGAAQERVLKVFLNDISSCDTVWVTENIVFLKDIISIGHDYKDYEKIFQTFPVFPNQLNELNEQSNLSIDGDIPEEIKKLYDAVVKPDFPIKSNLILNEFSDYLKLKTKKTIRNLTEKIEGVFFEDSISISLNNHPFKKEILQLIEEFKNNLDYEKYFPLLHSRRSAILVELADGEDTFSILSLEASRIKNLAKLGNNPDFDEIVRLGKNALMSQQQEKASFRHKYFIGTLVEEIVRERLSHIIGLRVQKPDGLDASREILAADEQNGQDIVIYLEDKPIYFIEVKSRWNENTSFRISRNQTIKAFNNNDKYSLVSVDMTKSTLENKTSINDISEISDVIKVNIDIGEKLDKELVNLYSESVNQDTFHIDGEFRTYVPFPYIDRGITIEEFEDYFIKEIQNKYDRSKK